MGKTILEDCENSIGDRSRLQLAPDTGQQAPKPFRPSEGIETAGYCLIPGHAV
jgi:hypothetical protein